MRQFPLALAWALVGAFAMLATAALGGVISAGDLDPPGSLASTMKSLDDLVPAWHRKLDSTGGCDSERFACVLDGEGVLDRETGLVWQLHPSETPVIWTGSVRDCYEATTGGRRGWRLPQVDELLTLKPTDGPGLPAGSPFEGISSALDVYYWSLTKEGDPSKAWSVTFAHLNPQPRTNDQPARTWCVRASNGVSPQ